MGARVMRTNNIGRELGQSRPELTEDELNHVVGGDTALQHEAVHADLPNNGIQFGGGRTPVAIIAILIGM
jgi:bacteriocin-like protein